MRFKCANRISIFLRSRFDCVKGLGAGEGTRNITSGYVLIAYRKRPVTLLDSA